MAAPFVTLLISGGMLAVLITLFQSEQRRGVRVARSIRVLFDRALEDTRQSAKRWYREMTGRTIRQSVHYIFHQVLTAILHRIQRLENFIRSVARRNKNRANRREPSTSSAHLSAIADHKRTTRLSEAEMQKRRDEALLGR